MSTRSGIGPGAGGSGTDRTSGDALEDRRPVERRGAALLVVLAARVGVAFAAGFLAAGLRAGAALRFVDLATRFVVVAARRVAPAARRRVEAAVAAPRDEAARASCCTWSVRRFNALSMSACFAVRRTCVSSWSMAVRSVF